MGDLRRCGEVRGDLREMYLGVGDHFALVESEDARGGERDGAREGDVRVARLEARRQLHLEDRNGHPLRLVDAAGGESR